MVKIITKVIDSFCIRLLVGFLLPALVWGHRVEAAGSQGELDMDKVKVTLHEQNSTLEAVFKSIESKTDFTFLYDETIVPVQRKVSIDHQDQSLTEALRELSGLAKLKFKQVNHVINVSVLESSKDEAVIMVEKTVSGRVTSAGDGEGIPGATVRVKGTTTGTVTDIDGNFSLKVPDDESVLSVTFIGYTTVEVRVGNQTELNIVLEENTEELDEVIVVGYGVQKKANVSGSVASISDKTISQRPTPNLQNLLQGRVAGMDIVQPTGEPGRDNAKINIRGVGSYGASSAPLILVNGVISSISNISPQDVESVTVLKDAASAAIYGSRAANGVILITTKTGKAGESNIVYNGSWSSSEATRYPELITDPVIYMEMFNSANARGGRPAIYTQEQIDLYRNNKGSEQYPEFDWLDYVLGKGPMQAHNLAFSGGNEKTTYNLSLNYLDQEAITKGYLYKRYNTLIDLSTKVHERVRVGTNLNLSFEDYKAPWLTNDNLLLLAYASAPTFKPFLPDGSGRLASKDFLTTGGNNRTVEEVYATGGKFTKRWNVNAQVFTDVTLAKNLTWMTKGAVTFFNEEYKERQYGTSSYAYHPNSSGEYQQVSNGNPSYFGLRQQWDRDITYTVFSTLNYTKTFNENHNLGILAGYEQQNYRGAFMKGNRYDFPNNTIMELDGSGPLNQLLGGSADEWALKSFFGRVNYNYKEKYFLEGNIRHDGTSRVDPRYRWGTFGGGSVAWLISNENFIIDNAQWIDNLKFRVSYGTLGNQEITRNNQPDYYPYQDILDLVSYPFESLTTGARLSRLTQRNLSWETLTAVNPGLDFDILNGLFGVTFDWYKKATTNILSTRTDVPASVGLSAPIVNAGAVENKGIELELRHRKWIGDFSYSVSGLLSKYENKVTKVLAPTLGTLEVGQPLNNHFVYDWIGIFQSEEEIQNSPKQPNSGDLKPGDLKIRDVDGNGAVGPEDRVRISSLPDYTYSFNLSAAWNGLSISAFFQGVQGVKTYVNGWGYDPFLQNAAPPVKFLNAWTPENPSTTVPAVYYNGYPGVAGYNSTYYLQDASYLRLKNLYLSYTLPISLLEKISAKEINVYVSGDNLITWTKYEGNDPERAGNGRFAQFPQLRIYTVGVKIKF